MINLRMFIMSLMLLSLQGCGCTPTKHSSIEYHEQNTTKIGTEGRGRE